MPPAAGLLVLLIPRPNYGQNKETSHECGLSVVAPLQDLLSEERSSSTLYSVG